MISRLICWFKGHKRGKRVAFAGDTADMGKRFQCPRCKATWFRKVKA